MMALIIGLLLLASPAFAEWEVAVYGGGAFTKDSKVAFTGLNTSIDNVTFDSSATVGGKVGYWVAPFDTISYGFGLDVFYFQPNIPQQTVRVRGPGGSVPAVLSPIKVEVLGIGFDVLKLRLHLAKDADVPMGRVQPMVSVGPALFLTDTDQSDGHTALGFKVAGGVQFLLTKSFGVFTEYRYTRYTAEPDIRSGFTIQPVETTLNTHHIVGGVALHF